MKNVKRINISRDIHNRLKSAGVYDCSGSQKQAWIELLQWYIENASFRHSVKNYLGQVPPLSSRKAAAWIDNIPMELWNEVRKYEEIAVYKVKDYSLCDAIARAYLATKTELISA